MRILGDQDEASDLLQKVYAEIWCRADRYDKDRGRLLAWMMTLTRSRAIDRLHSEEWESRDFTKSYRSRRILYFGGGLFLRGAVASGWGLPPSGGCQCALRDFQSGGVPHAHHF